MPLQIGLRGRAALRVAADHTAERLGSGDLPVFGTPALAALFEAAAVNALAGHLAPGETTVGTRIDLSHSAPSPLGAEVVAEAELVAVEGRTLRFAATARDGSGPIGDCRHERVIVTRDRFLGRLKDRTARPAPGRADFP
jgi:fluoroacetyl-CoA thioesterase